MNKKILSVVLILCVMLAVMPMTAYAADRALCTKCNQVQTVRMTSQYADGKWHLFHVTCTVCNNEWSYGMSHEWSGTATCTSGRTCTVCGGSSEPLGHDWGTWTQNSDEKTHTRICKRDTSHTETENCHGGTATCTQRATCTVCGAEYGDALGHDFTTSWTHDDNEHWKQCSRCDAKDDVSPHTWDSGTITTAPTCTKAGKKTYSCTKCDATKIEPIPATGHSWKSDWTSDATHHWYECDNKNCDVTDNAGKKGYAEHSGGKATCTQNAVCEFCKAEYGEKLPHDFTVETVDAKYLKSAATCTEKAVYYKSCAVCGLSSEGTADEATFFSGNALDHNWGAWTQNSDEKTHTRICKRDTSHTETENCHGGTATCTAKAVCTVCGGEYGEMAAHSFTAEKAEAQYLKSAATCTEKAIYYKSCAVCGLSSEGTADEATFFSGNALDHNWGAWTQNSDEKTHTRICKRDTSHTETENCHGGTATCTAKAVCTVCGGEYGEVDMTNHTDTTQWIQTETTHTQKYKCCGVIVVPEENHEWKDGVCTECDYECVHQYNWQSENGMYWQHCTICGFDTNKKAIPTIPINGADKVCRTQDYKFSFALPEGATDAAYGYEFIGLGDGPLTPTVEDNLYSGILKATIYPAEENSFKLIVSAKTADGFEFSAEKTVAIQNEHSGGTATCTEQATCEICGEKYGDLKPHSYSADWVMDETSHWHECTECGAKTDEAEHIDADKDHKCDICEKVLSECADNDKDHKCDICGKTLSEHSGGTATCKDKAKCEVCGESYGEPDADNHTDLQHFPAVAATKTSEGNIEYWYCSGCGKYYKDAKATQEITKADTVTAKLPEEKPTSPKTGDTSNLTLWIALLLASGGVGTITTVVSRKKKRSVK